VIVLTTEEKLIHFQEDAMMTAREKSGKELDAYSENLNNLYEEHCKTAEAQATHQLRLAKEALYREHNRQLSKKQLETRRNLSLTKESVTEELFARVNEMIKTYKEGPAYVDALLKSIREAKATAKGQELSIYIDKSDAALAEKLSSRSGLSVQIAPDSIVGGILAIIPDKNILIDLSFATRLKEARENLQLGGEGHV
jgi:vacuolar-type H+-ATPase subunit E/Vma4